MEFIPGALQALTRVTISYPMDVIKTICQSENKKPLDIFKEIMKSDKKKFFRGSSLPYFYITLERSIQFKFYEELNKIYNPFISGFLITLPLSLFTVPMQCLNNNFVISKERRPIKYCKKIILNYGSSFLYRGYFQEMIRYTTATTVYMGVYGNLRKENSTNYEIAGISIISSYATWMISYPLDLIKTLSQINVDWKSEILNRINKNGITSLWKGITPVLIRTAPSSIIGMLVYEFSRKKIMN